MRSRSGLAKITLADFIVRAGYQMGKTPLLPILAASLGASDVLLGLVVSVSTLTGMFTKPLFGVLSDRQGRKFWILIGTLLFAGFPFLYRFIDTPGQLMALRLLHGTATAIYGPVTVAYVAERGGKHKAERLGWFGMARTGGYIVGPAAAGWLLLWNDPVDVFTVIGLLSLLAFFPVLMLEETTGDRGLATGEQRLETSERRTATGDWGRGIGDQSSDATRPTNPNALRTTYYAIRSLFRIPTSALRLSAVWLSGGMEAVVYVATYAIKAFLPIYALSAGYNTAEIGLFFSVQEGVNLLLKPAGGRAGDRIGYFWSVALGMTLLALLLPLLMVASHLWMLVTLAALMGASQALIFQATIALVAEQIDPDHLGAGMGVVGTLRNLGKVVGPLLGGLLIAWLSYRGMLWLLGGLLLCGALVVAAVLPKVRVRRAGIVASRGD